jgi:hypothetical protein
MLVHCLQRNSQVSQQSCRSSLLPLFHIPRSICLDSAKHWRNHLHDLRRCHSGLGSWTVSERWRSHVVHWSQHKLPRSPVVMFLDICSLIQAGWRMNDQVEPTMRRPKVHRVVTWQTWKYEDWKVKTRRPCSSTYPLQGESKRIHVSVSCTRLSVIRQRDRGCQRCCS